MKRYPIVLLVVLFPILWFCIDKIFALEGIQEYTIPWKKIEIIFYESRKDLYSIYQERLPEYRAKSKKRAVILGTSRSGEFSTQDIQAVLPEFVTYNFSAPFAGPLFHFYWLEKIYEVDPELSLVILEVDPLVFSKSSLSYTLSYSLDFPYVWRESSFFPQRWKDPWQIPVDTGMAWEEWETWVTKRMFASYRYPLDWNAIRDNREKSMVMLDGKLIHVSGKDYKKLFREMVLQANKKELGAIPNQIYYQGDEKFLKKDAENMANLHLGENFQPSTTQIAFFKKILHLTRTKNTQLILYWPVVSQYFREELEKRNLIEEYKSAIKKEISIHKEKNPNWKPKIWDPYENPKFQCRAFIDSVHLSGACYKNLFSTLTTVTE